MPSTATITSFYSFATRQKAYASRFNNNFDVMAGHRLPINTGLPIASDSTYDLGYLEYRWNNLYIQTIYFKALTTTARGQFSYDSSNSTGAYSIKIGGTERYNFSPSATVWNLATTTGEFIFNLAGTQYAKIDSNGLDIMSRWHMNFTSSSVDGNIARGAQVNSNYSTSGATTINVAGSTCTVVTSGRRPVMIGVINATISNFLVTLSGFDPGVDQPAMNVIIRRSGTNVQQAPYLIDYLSNPSFEGYEYPANIISMDFPAAGTYHYHLAIVTGPTTTTDCAVRGRVVAWEML